MIIETYDNRVDREARRIIQNITQEPNDKVLTSFIDSSLKRARKLNNYICDC